MQIKKYIFLILGSLLVLAGCDDTWSEHYNTKPETVDQYLWDVLKADPNASKFVEYMEQTQLDSLFTKEKYFEVYSLFVPTNSAFESFEGEIDSLAMQYHILRHFIQPNNVVGQRKFQTLSLKFAQFENRNQEYFFDNIPVSFTSPLYIDGRYFVIDNVAQPKPSLYEYIAANNPILKRYIDLQDSIILDKELSKPLYFDDNGNTVYDSVINVINLFEEEFFEVSEEFRVKTATLVYPKEKDYQEALTEMALNLTGSGYTSYADIDEEWQQEILIPYLLEKGVFANQREPIEFQSDTLLNILDKEVIIHYTPVEKTVCSNGYAYNYSNFEILDSLYLRPVRNEMETRILDPIGNNRFNWREGVTVTTDKYFTPNADFVNSASNDSIVNITFPLGYEGKFNVEFETVPLFPRKYLVVIRTHMDYGGIYEFYINDELVKTWDYYDFARRRGIIPSVVSGVRYIADGRFNKFDFWLDNLEEYGPAKIRIEYKEPGKVSNNGFVFDYIEFVSEEMMDDITKNP